MGLMEYPEAARCCGSRYPAVGDDVLLGLVFRRCRTPGRGRCDSFWRPRSALAVQHRRDLGEARRGRGQYCLGARALVEDAALLERSALSEVRVGKRRSQCHARRCRPRDLCKADSDQGKIRSDQFLSTAPEYRARVSLRNSNSPNLASTTGIRRPAIRRLCWRLAKPQSDREI